MDKEYIENLRKQEDVVLFVVFRNLKKRPFIFYPIKVTLLLPKKDYPCLPEFSDQSINTHIWIDSDRVSIMLNYQDIAFIIPYRLGCLSLIHTYDDWKAHKQVIDTEIIAFNQKLRKLF